MSIEKIDAAIERMIDRLVEEHGRTGILTTTSDERKSQIIEEIAKLRASMNPKCDCQK
jgi:hypothetical protein